MPREIVLGNGEMLVNLDGSFQIRDLYYPYVGWANHVGGHRCRVGIWAEDTGFAWIDESWERQVAYQDDTLVTNCAATHAGLGVRLKMVHAVLHDRNVFVTRYKIENLRDTERQVRLFLAQDLRVDESDIGDTVFYSPYGRALVHYKRDRYFLFGGYGGRGVPQIATSPRQLAAEAPTPEEYLLSAAWDTLRLTEERKPIGDVHIDALLESVLERRGDGLELVAGSAPTVHINGEREPLPYEDLTPRDVQQMLYGVLTDEQIQEFERRGQIDFSYALEKRAHFDAALYKDKGSVAGTLFLSSSAHAAASPSPLLSLLGPAQYACGEKGFKGAEGAWRDAEDGAVVHECYRAGSS